MTDCGQYGMSIDERAVPRDGSGDAAAGIQVALDSGAPLVVVPYGTYRLDRGLRIGSGTHLAVHPEARMLYGDGAGRHVDDFLLSNRNPDAGDTAITVSGGIWDGNNRRNPRGREGDPDAYTGTLINMKHVTGLTLRDMRLKDSTAYFTRLTRVRDFRIERIGFQLTHELRNQDGIHCAGHCENGEIHDIEAHGTYTTGDDLVALNADDALLRSELQGAEAGPIQNIRISNIRADDCHSFVRMASIWAPIEDIDVRGVYGGFRCMALNADALRYCRVPLFKADDPAYANGVGMLRRIRYADACVFKSGTSGAPYFQLESRMDDLRLANIRRDSMRDASPEAALVVIRNVWQQRVAATCRVGAVRPQPANCRVQSLAGCSDTLRLESEACIEAFELADSPHLLDLQVGEPVMHPLPPPNNRVGLVVPSAPGGVDEP